MKMGKDIYELLNSVETDLDEYTMQEMQESEVEENMNRILRKLKGDGKTHRIRRKRQRINSTIKAAAIFAAVLLSAGGVAYAATDGEVFQEIFTLIGGGTLYETKEYSEEEGRMVTASSSGTAVVMPIGEESGVPLLLEDDRLYFTGDGGKTDITDEISETEPYYIEVIDEAGNTHRFIIGGRAEAGYYGYDEWLFDKDGNFKGGGGSFGKNIEKAGGIGPEWYEKAWDELMKTLHP